MNLEPLKRFLNQSLGSPYVYGATGKPCTPGYREARMRQYPGMAAAIRRHCPVLSGQAAGCSRCLYRGKLAYDCAQLTRQALRGLGILLPSGASSQWKAPGIWAWRGPISPLAARWVCLLFREDREGSKTRPMAHVGISLGNGWVVDARGHAAGVIKSKITAYPWTHMAFLKQLPLPEDLRGQPAHADAPILPPAPQPRPPAQDLHSLRLSPGDRGAGVRLLQTQLLRLGYPLPRFGADGIYGLETMGALKAFQHVAGLVPDGLCDRATLEKLFPRPQPQEEMIFPEEDEAFDLY